MLRERSHSRKRRTKTGQSSSRALQPSINSSREKLLRKNQNIRQITRNQSQKSKDSQRTSWRKEISSPDFKAKPIRIESPRDSTELQREKKNIRGKLDLTNSGRKQQKFKHGRAGSYQGIEFRYADGGLYQKYGESAANLGIQKSLVKMDQRGSFEDKKMQMELRKLREEKLQRDRELEMTKEQMEDLRMTLERNQEVLSKLVTINTDRSHNKKASRERRRNDYFGRERY